MRASSATPGCGCRSFADLTKQTAILEAVTGLGGLVVVATGTHLVATDALEPAILPMLTLLAMAAFLPVSEIAHIGRQLADTLGATRRLYAVHNEVEPVTDGPGVGAPLRPGGVGIEVRDVQFSYFGNRRLALDGATFTVPAGKTLALVGPSGAGKTTAAHLLMRFWDPGSGVVRFDGHDLREYRLDELRDRIALVTQDTYLFNETLRANILIAKPNATAAALDEAVHRASLGPVRGSAPRRPGDAASASGGVRLSGGQRQRVAIARAFLKDAQVLILDEATSHLDAVNEQAVAPRPRGTDVRTHDDRHRAPPVHGAQRRPDRRARRRPHPGDRGDTTSWSPTAASTAASSGARWRGRRSIDATWADASLAHANRGAISHKSMLR